MPPPPFPQHIPSPQALKTYLQRRNPEAPLEPKKLLMLWSSALLASRRGRLIEALEDHVLIIRKAPEMMHTAPIWFNIGALWASLGQLNLALDSYEISALGDPSFTIAWYCLGAGCCLIHDYQRASMAFFFCDYSIHPNQEMQSYDEYGLGFDIIKTVAAWNYRITRDRYRTIHRIGPPISNIDDGTFQYSALMKILEPHSSYFNLPDYDAYEISTINLKKRGKIAIHKIKLLIWKIKDIVAIKRSNDSEEYQEELDDIISPPSFDYYLNRFQDMLPYIDLTSPEPTANANPALGRRRPLKTRKSEPILKPTTGIPSSDTQLTFHRNASEPVLPGYVENNQNTPGQGASTAPNANDIVTSI